MSVGGLTVSLGRDVGGVGLTVLLGPDVGGAGLRRRWA